MKAALRNSRTLVLARRNPRFGLSPGARRPPRSGMVSLEAVLSLAVTFTFAMTMYLIGEVAVYRLFHFIAAMVGSPIV